MSQEKQSSKLDKVKKILGGLISSKYKLTSVINDYRCNNIDEEIAEWALDKLLNMSISELKAFHDKNDITDFLSKTSENYKSQNIALDLFRFMETVSMKSYDQLLMENCKLAILGLNAATKLKQEFLFQIAKEDKEKLLRGEKLNTKYAICRISVYLKNDEFLEELKKTEFTSEQILQFTNTDYESILHHIEIRNPIKINDSNELYRILKSLTYYSFEENPNLKLDLTGMQDFENDIDYLDGILDRKLFDSLILSDKQKHTLMEYISEYKEELLKDSMKYLKPNSVNRIRKRI
jgi:hypothetical protein